MKRIIFLYIIFFTFFISCKTNTSIPTKQDNTLQKLSNSELDSYTFCADIINNSDYEISINSLIIPTKTIIQNQELPLHSSEIYDGIIITYKIPLTDFVYYKHIEKKLIADNQTKIIIENPTKITVKFPALIVV